MIKLWRCYFLDGPHPYCLVFQGEFKEKSKNEQLMDFLLRTLFLMGSLAWGGGPSERAFPRNFFAARIPFKQQQQKRCLSPETSLKTFPLGEE